MQQCSRWMYFGLKWLLIFLIQSPFIWGFFSFCVRSIYWAFAYYCGFYFPAIYRPSNSDFGYLRLLCGNKFLSNGLGWFKSKLEKWMRLKYDIFLPSDIHVWTQFPGKKSTSINLWVTKLVEYYWRNISQQKNTFLPEISELSCFAVFERII
jgi:hypothetical protein